MNRFAVTWKRATCKAVAFTLTVGLAATLAAARPMAAELPAWEVDPARSAIVFEFTQLGSPIEGRFTTFDAEIRLDPQTPAIDTRVVIDTASLDTGDEDRDKEARGPAFFSVGDHPEAVFEASGLSGENGQFEASGTLTIKGVAQAVALPFTLTVDGGDARAEGTITVDRQDFEIGTGDWATNGAIGDDVTIRVTVVATRVR